MICTTCQRLFRWSN